MEIWKDIKGYEGLYQVSNYERVKALGKGKYNSKERFLNVRIGCRGYKMVMLCKNGKKQNKPIHKLMSDAFIPNPDNLPCVNHKDENKLNNRIYINEDGSINFEKSNLEWCTQKYNCNYGSRIENIKKHFAETGKSKTVLQYDLKGKLINEWCSINDAAKYTNSNRTSISSCCNGRLGSHHNYIWKFKN